jgi:glycosyltransferase involved in cell wall biosynthesis
MTEELITIGIPVYNMEKSIAEAVKSSLRQTYKNIEILVVNDGSTDNSIQIVRELKDDRIRIYEREMNGGVCMAMRDLVSNAKGKYIAFLDADDSMMETRVEKQYKAIKQAELQYSNRMVASFCGSLVKNITDGSTHELNPNDLFNNRAKHPFGGGTGHSMYKVSDILKLGNFDVRFSRSADFALCLKFLLNDGFYAMIDEPLIQYNCFINKKKKKIEKVEISNVACLELIKLVKEKNNRDIYLERIFFTNSKKNFYFLGIPIFKIRNTIKNEKKYKLYRLFGITIFKKEIKNDNLI